jgi:NAD(P)-dependent dehydrogenase (short-subunit alcohol dehydrogenase family)
MTTYLITGALRGIGLALTQALLTKPASEVKLVIAAARKRNHVYEDLSAKHAGRVAFVQMELNQASVKNAAEEVEKILQGGGLDVLVNNAGVLPITPSVATMSEFPPSWCILDCADK